MSRKTDYHMTPDEFREAGRRVVDWIAEYYEWIETHPVLAQVKPGDVRRELPSGPPENGETVAQMLDDVDRIIMPGITHWQSPGFHAYFPSNSSFPAILGEMISAGLGVQGMLWKTSPACTELETHVMDWTARMLGLPEAFLSPEAFPSPKKDGEVGGGVIQDTASSAILCALLAARERATGGGSNREGCDRTLVAYTSSQANSSVQKAARIAGIGDENIRLIDVDADFAMRTDLLEQAIKADRIAGKIPFFVCATTGTTSSLAFDPIHEIGQICRDAENPTIWLHVDAAMAGTAAVCPEFRGMHDGIELADSYCFNPHKWMFTTFDCDCMWVRDRSALTAALSILPEYLRTPESDSGGVIDYRDWQIPLGRRFRAMKLWFVIRHYGVEGLRHHVRRHIELAEIFAGWVRASESFELVAPPSLCLVCLAHRGGDKETQRRMEAVNATGKHYLSHTKLNGRYVIRMNTSGRDTEIRHIESVWRLLNDPKNTQ